MNKSGQLSFEIALLTVLIFLLVFLAAGQYFQVHDTTYAVAKLKAATIAELGTLDKQHAIKRIDYRVEGHGTSLRMEIYGDPKFGAEEVKKLREGALGSVCGEIIAETVFDTVGINFDGPQQLTDQSVCGQVTAIYGP